MRHAKNGGRRLYSGRAPAKRHSKAPQALEMFEDLFNGVAPYIQQARAKKVDKYTVKANTDTPSI